MLHLQHRRHFYDSLSRLTRLLHFKESLKSILTLMLKHERAQASEREKAMARERTGYTRQDKKGRWFYRHQYTDASGSALI